MEGDHTECLYLLMRALDNVNVDEVIATALYFQNPTSRVSPVHVHLSLHSHGPRISEPP